MANVQLTDRFGGFVWKQETAEKEQAKPESVQPREKRRRMSYFESLEMLFAAYFDTVVREDR